MFNRKREEKKQIALQAFYNIEDKILDKLEAKDKIVTFTSTSNHTDQAQNVYNIARHLAEDGEKILILDGNLRNPQIEDVSQRGKERGFMDELLDDYSHSSLVEVDKDYNNLYILSTGKVSDYADRFLEINDIRNYFDNLRKSYDYIFINAGENIDIPEANLFASLADKCIVFTAYANKDNDIYKKSISQLEKVSADILGVIVTNYVYTEAEIDELFGD
ncbi:MAG: CpsD/CapB family tyrosine-protein kinase [Anaerococcus sp.]|nr:CpsD/CapB family tyrosine-protein kinase [Anaerococcus sp.]